MSGRRAVCLHPGCPTLTTLRYCDEHDDERTTGWASSKRNQQRNPNRRAERAENARIIEAARGICHVCRQPGADEVDHVVNRASLGSDAATNKAPIHCGRCARCRSAGHLCHVTKTTGEAARSKANRA